MQQCQPSSLIRCSQHPCCTAQLPHPPLRQPLQPPAPHLHLHLHLHLTCTVMTPSLPTFSMALAISSPISLSPLAEMVPT